MGRYTLVGLTGLLGVLVGLAVAAAGWWMVPTNPPIVAFVVALVGLVFTGGSLLGLMDVAGEGKW